jgi:cardiolipin synthase
MYLDDLTNATEVVLDRRHRPSKPPGTTGRPAARADGSGSRAAAGLLRVSNTVGAAISDHRELEAVEARIMLVVGLVLLGVGVLVALVPRLLAYPVAAVVLWVGGALLYRGYRLLRRSRAGRLHEG